jgi:hypothetical protein
MSRTLQFKRYANTVVANTTGANGELIIDSTNDTITVHDGVTQGGNRLATETYVNLSSGLAQDAYDFANTRASYAYAQAAYAQANTVRQTVPQNRQTTNHILNLTDAGRHLYYTQSSNVVLYIPPALQEPFANGSIINIISNTTSGANVTITPNNGVSLYVAGNTTSSSRNVTSYGVATLIQVAENTWFVYGQGVI